jgi:surface polysaccharide O-acyltransferase-like enzyme
MKDSKVQTLRGLACLLLVVYHVIGATENQGLRINDGWLRQLTEALGALRMPVFGLVAGALYGFSSKRGWSLVRDKAARLLWPMLSVGTAFALLQTITPGSNFRVDDLYLLHIVPVAHYWFLESLFLIFCAMALVESVLPLRHMRSWFGYFAASVLVYLAHPGFIWFSVLGATYLSPYFLLGVGLTRLQWDARQERTQSGLLRIALGALVVAWLMAQGTALERFSAPMLAAGLLLASGFWSLGLRNTLLARIGDYSFAIYLFHVLFTSATRMGLHALGLESPVPVLLISVPVGVLGPALLLHLLARSRACSTYLLGNAQPLQAAA